ncbi:hypothetical protein RHMOL_Rhmol10G0057100 [Rhododendron molle]|uniref:Uncharacterized protein n=1 Tax=Rhododendron molle TaxID=49168 RepID=A0ACC0M0A9_RHOML|nr:hypothetical protein RHMOL_Rhmol10G0057100 [Rhododendron molle]
MISRYAVEGLAKHALSLFEKMEETGLKPDDGTAISISCLHTDDGIYIFFIFFDPRQLDMTAALFVYNAFVGMYAKCGSLNR